jgi:hypothetical protein
MWSNADEVVQFLDSHRNRRYEVGETFVLPDIGQEFEVMAVRPFRHNGKFHLFLDLIAMCAIEDCTDVLAVSVDINRWRKSRYLPRCCPEHSYQFKTPMQNAWKTAEELADIAEARLQVRQSGDAQTPGVRVRIGAVQYVVLDVLYDWLELLGDKPDHETVIATAVDRLPPPAAGERDTRRQRATRALQLLLDKGLIDTPIEAIYGV